MDTKPQPKPQADFRWLWGFIWAHKRAAALAFFSGMVGGIATAIEPYVIGRMIDDLKKGATSQSIGSAILTLLLLTLIAMVAFYFQRLFSGMVAYNVLYDVRRSIFQNLVTLDQDFYQRHPTGDLIARMHNDMDIIWRLMAITSTRIGSAIFLLLTTFLLLATTNLGLTLMVFVVLTISTSFQIRAGVVINPMFEEVQNQGGTLASLVQDTVSGIQTVKTFGRESGAAKTFLRENLEYRRRWLRFKRRYEPVGMLPNMISSSTAGIVVLFGGVLTINQVVTVGNFTQFLLYLAHISTVLLQLGIMYQRYQQTRGALARLTPMLQRPSIVDAPHAQPLTTPQGDIDFDHVGLQWGGKWLLRDISLHIPAGQTIALVGPTGCGKILLANLVARIFDATEGQVKIDGQDVRTLKLDDLRRAVAYVPQTTFLFSQPLHQNVRMSRRELDAEILTRAIHISRVSNDLPQLPEGLETMVGEKGVMLSGGQKQRVAIARAIVHDPAILILDDALSSVDTQTAADILGDLRSVLRQRTSLIIAHRIATIKDADRIYVMDRGQIIEQGTHNELIAVGGMYCRMVERELRQEQEKSTIETDTATTETSATEAEALEYVAGDK